MISNNKQDQFVRRLKKGDRAAFNEMVVAYRERGFAIAYRMVGNAEDAKDILQEAFIRVFTNINHFKEKAHFHTWLYRIVVNCAWDHLRKRKKHKMESTQAAESEVFNDEGQSDDTVLNNELASTIDSCARRLSDRQRSCFILKYQNGLSIYEIAETLGCNASTVKVHLFRALGKMRKALNAYKKGG